MKQRGRGDVDYSGRKEQGKHLYSTNTEHMTFTTVLHPTRIEEKGTGSQITTRFPRNESLRNYWRK